MDKLRRLIGDRVYYAMKIKYLQVPDTLLDAVKEEQNRAREAGRSARGAHVSGTRGTPAFALLTPVRHSHNANIRAGSTTKR
jgi:hypothetical protein